MPTIDLAPALSPILPKAPPQYDQRYMNQLVATLEAQLRAGSQARLVVVSGIMTVGLPTAVTGLRSGEVYNDGGILKVAP